MSFSNKLSRAFLNQVARLLHRRQERGAIDSAAAQSVALPSGFLRVPQGELSSRRRAGGRVLTPSQRRIERRPDVET